MTRGLSPYAGTTPVPSHASGTGAVTLLEGQTFCIADRAGDVEPDLPHGLFILDTRVLSTWQLRIDRHALEPLGVEVEEPFAATFVGRARPREGHADADVVLFRHRSLGLGMREAIAITNHGLEAVTLVVDLRCGVDFADLFDVKQGHVVRRGEQGQERTHHGVRHTVRTGAQDKAVDIAFDRPAAAVDEDTWTWVPALAPGATWRLEATLTVSMAGHALHGADGEDPGTVPPRRSSAWRASLPVLTTDHPALRRAVETAGSDIGALLLADPEHPEDLVPAAGAPWFMTLFGRDSLLTAWMALIVDRSLARGVLRTLARLQGRDHDPRTEEEPGKILHEVRFGSADSGLMRRGARYYGSIDATPLFVVLLGELDRWDDDPGTVDDLIPHADRALEWIDAWGDRDGDGYVEYQRLSPDGLVNQGWKDSWDAIRHPGGRLADGPIALCEVQGYVYAAFTARAELARARGDEVTRARCEARARDLRRRFEEDFWLDAEGTFAVGLDGDKEPIAAVTSNVGHCLWSGLVSPERAGSVGARLVADDMWSGWGIRTLARSMPAYNPVSYHSGSVWPHDTALCAAGLARYGLVTEAHRVIEGQLAVAEAFGGRLPELFAGFGPDQLRHPASYPSSCSPQAWASAAPLLWLRTLLGAEPDGDAVAVGDRLPPWLDHLRLDGVRVAGRRVALEVARSPR